MRVIHFRCSPRALSLSAISKYHFQSDSHHILTCDKDKLHGVILHTRQYFRFVSFTITCRPTPFARIFAKFEKWLTLWPPPLPYVQLSSLPDRVKPSFEFLTSGHSYAQPWASECPEVKNYKWLLNLIWQGMLYSCTHMATVGVKGLTPFHICKDEFLCERKRKSFLHMRENQHFPILLIKCDYTCLEGKLTVFVRFQLLNLMQSGIWIRILV